MHTAFCFNLDGTLTTAEVLPCIASEFGVSEEIATLAHAAMNGHLELETSLKLLYLILGKVPTEKVHEIVSNIPLDKVVLSFIGSHKTDSFILTGKLDKWMEPISRKCGCRIYSSERSYCQELCMERLGSDPIYFHSIHKFDSSDYFCQALRMIQSNPSFLSTLA